MEKYIYFSGTGSTQRIMNALGANNTNSLDITRRRASDEELSFSGDDLVFVGFPVYGGRVPEFVLDHLENLAGGNCRLVVVAVYGNRHYDDALNEMQAFVEKRGCNVVATLAAVAKHNMVPTIAPERPDAEDIKRLAEIKSEISTKLALGELRPLPMRPVETYREFKGLPVHPVASELCTECGLCAEECPMQAINHDDVHITDDSLCITCMHCSYVCPVQARQLPLQVQTALSSRLEAICNTRREIELFINA